MDAKQPLSRTQFQHARNSCGCTHPLEQNVEVRGNEEDTVALITDFFAIKNFFMGPKKRDNNSKLQVKVHDQAQAMKMFNQIDKQTHPSRTLITGLSFNFANGLMDRPSKRIRLGKSLEEIQKEEQEIRDKEIQLLGEAETEQFVMDNILLSVAAELLDKEDEELEKENKTPTIKTKSMQKDKKRKRLEVYGLF